MPNTSSYAHRGRSDNASMIADVAATSAKRFLERRKKPKPDGQVRVGLRRVKLWLVSTEKSDIGADAMYFSERGDVWYFGTIGERRKRWSSTPLNQLTNRSTTLLATWLKQA